MSDQDGWKIANRMNDAADRAMQSADRIEAAAHRIAILLEDGYGGNGLRLIELLQSTPMPTPQKTENPAIGKMPSP